MMSMAGATKVYSILRVAVMPKVIGLSETAEPEIYATTHRYGTILENVPYRPDHEINRSG